MLPLEPDPRSYLPKRIRRCPQCGDSDRVQVIIYGLPAFPPSPEEEHRVTFAGCMWPDYEKTPKWFCPTCGVSYTGRGEIVEEPDEVW
jgi:predicted RNA-binding Zn-ribbon protein involved in translation (DUF1610 family)